MGEVTDGAPCRGAAHSGRAPGVLGLWFGGPVEAGFVSAGESVLAARRETPLGWCCCRLLVWKSRCMWLLQMVLSVTSFPDV